MKKHIPFTIIEMLAVVAIIGVLSAFLFPAIGRARLRGAEASCLSNLRQFGLAIANYRQDYREAMPPWLSTLYRERRYMPSNKIYLCPLDGNDSGTAYSDWRSEKTAKYTDAYDRTGNTGLYGNDPCVKTSANDPDDKAGPVSYFYEFNESICPWGKSEGYVTGSGNFSWNDVKQGQIRIGKNTHQNNKRFKSDLSYFPSVRCYWHLEGSGDNQKPMLNLSLTGNTFKSLMEWERGILP